MPRTKKGALPVDPGAGVQAVLMALSLLETLARSGSPQRVTDLALELGQTKGRISRYLSTLAKSGYVLQDDDTGWYRSGPQLIVLGQNVVDSLNIVNEARPFMQRLRDELGHAVGLAQMIGDRLFVVDVLQGKSPFAITQARGTPQPYHASANGKIALAFGPPSLSKRVLGTPLDALTPHTIIGPKKLKQEIEGVVERGWAVSPNQVNVGINGLAAPIFDARGLLVGSIVVLDLIYLLPAEPTEKQISAVLAAANGISLRLGFNNSIMTKSQSKSP